MNQAEHTQPLAAQLLTIIEQMIEQAVETRVNTIITPMIEQAVEQKVAERLLSLEQWVQAQTIPATAVGQATPTPTSAQAVQLVRNFLAEHGDTRFQLPGQKRTPHSVGYKKLNYDANGVEEFMILPNAFREIICKGFDPQLVAKALHHGGYLALPPSKKKGYTAQRRLPEYGKKLVSVYALKAIILTHGSDQPLPLPDADVTSTERV